MVSFSSQSPSFYDESSLLSRTRMEMELEEKRKEKSKFAYERKKQLAKLLAEGEKVVEEKLDPSLSKEKFDNEDGPCMPLMLVAIDYMAKNVHRRGEDFNPLAIESMTGHGICVNDIGTVYGQAGAYSGSALRVV
ncbi:hypothetical protein Dimus_037617, partial [Dionaea muscipula]